MSQPNSRQARLRAELEEALRGASDVPSGPLDEADPSELYGATVVDVSGSDVIVELGPRVQGAVPLEEFDEPPRPGTRLELALSGREDGLWTFSVKLGRTLATWNEMEVGSLVKGRVIGVNKGGLELKVSGLNAFLPASQVALTHVDDLESLAGETLLCEVLELDRSKRRIVVSRRAVLEEEARQRRLDLADALVVGSVLRGRVARLESYGAFVDLGGVEGLLHVSNLSHKRVEHPEELLKVGDEVEVQVLKIEEGGRRIGLGRKQLEEDPWDAAAEKLHEDSLVQGRVQRLTDFGAFVEVLPGVDGLLHVSQLGAGRVRHVSEVLKVGEEVTVRVLSVDPIARRISLSRLDPRGALLGSEEAAAGDDIDAVLDQGSALSTNLGSLFQAALRKGDSSK